MADKIEENNEEPVNESGYTNFGGSAGRSGTYYTPTGPISLLSSSLLKLNQKFRKH
jgi:hypothetical protein